MQVFTRGQSRDHISTAVMGTVLECHDQGVHLLSGMVPSVHEEYLQLFTPDGLPNWGQTRDFRHRVETGTAHPTTSPPEPESPVGDDRTSTEEPAVRHLREMMSMSKDGKLAYLSEAGMEKCEAANLISLVVGWVDQAGLERLAGLSRVAAQRKLGPSHILQRWINGRCQLRLAMLLDDPGVNDSDLAVAYAVAHAADSVLASYWSDLDAEDDAISVVPGDDLG